MDISKEKYAKQLEQRGKRSRIYHKHQLIGLQMSQELGDKKHRALYMKLAKEGNQAKLQWLAADVASREKVKNKGAYFMAQLMKTEKEAKEWLKSSKKKK